MKKILISGILVCSVFTLCIFAQKGKLPSGCGSDFAANLYVNPGTNISSDPNGPLYANGGSKNNKISIGFQVGNCSYDLIIQLNNSTRYLVTNVPGQGTFNAKFANFDRIASVPITTNNAAMSDFCGTSPTGSYKYDNYGGCGSDAGGAYVRRNVGFDLGNNLNNLRFQYSPIDNPNGNPNAGGTAYIRVYHPDANTWHLVPESPEVGAFLTNGIRTDSPVVPFWFTVTRQ